jgi:WhiB family transcriptional regulator, redox-sensing transcriptional regulator
MNTDWYKDAACKGTDPELFYGKGHSQGLALRICANCPVMQECRLSGDKEEELDGYLVYGVRGGEMREERLTRRGYSTIRFEIDRAISKEKVLARLGNR